jgi:hypothetical protein
MALGKITLQDQQAGCWLREAPVSLQSEAATHRALLALFAV